jgi:hypothetical protein
MFFNFSIMEAANTRRNLTDILPFTIMIQVIKATAKLSWTEFHTAEQDQAATESRRVNMMGWT